MLFNTLLELLGFTEKELAKLLDEVGVGVGEAEDEFAYHEQLGVTVTCGARRRRPACWWRPGLTLYDVELGLGAVASLFGGLTPGNIVEYTEIGPDIYFVVGNILRRINPSGVVSKPGIAAIGSNRPSLTEGPGGLFPGRYGVAYRLLSDTGEESGLSDTAWIDVTTGGISIANMTTADNVTKVNVYATSANGSELYLH